MNRQTDIVNVIAEKTILKSKVIFHPGKIVIVTIFKLFVHAMFALHGKVASFLCHHGY